MMKAQARLGETKEEIIKSFPNRKFESGQASDGTKYLTTDLSYGLFVYYFDEIGRSDFNLLILKNLGDATELAEIYNSKYTIIGESKWRALLKNNYMMYIELIYDSEFESYMIKYSLQL